MCTPDREVLTQASLPLPHSALVLVLFYSCDLVLVSLPFSILAVLFSKWNFYYLKTTDTFPCRKGFIEQKWQSWQNVLFWEFVQLRLCWQNSKTTSFREILSKEMTKLVLFLGLACQTDESVTVLFGQCAEFQAFTVNLMCEKPNQSNAFCLIGPTLSKSLSLILFS